MQQLKARPMQPGEQIQVDLRNAEKQACECGCELFIPASMIFTMSAIVSPIGKAITIPGPPMMVCLECRKPYQEKGGGNGKRQTTKEG